MDSREAFDAIQNGINVDPRKRLVKSFFDEINFGNFWITYEEGGEQLSLVNDRGQLILNDGPAGDSFRVIVNDLRSADENAILEAF